MPGGLLRALEHVDEEHHDHGTPTSGSLIHQEEASPYYSELHSIARSGSTRREFRKAVDVFPLPRECPKKKKARLKRKREGLPWDDGWVCGDNDCLYCNTFNAVVLASAIFHSRPNLMFGITPVFETWTENQGLSKNIRSGLKKGGFDIEWAYAVERSRTKGVPHIHGFARMTPLDSWTFRTALNTLSHRCGAGNAWAKDFALDRNTCSYPLKTVMIFSYGYPDRPTAQAALDDYRVLNGRQLCHFSKGFLIDDGGKRINQEDAERYARERLRSGLEDAG